MKYQVYLIDSDTGEPTPKGRWGSEGVRFDDRSEADYAVTKLERFYPGTKWEIREVPETWSANLKNPVTVPE